MRSIKLRVFIWLVLVLILIAGGLLFFFLKMTSVDSHYSLDTKWLQSKLEEWKPTHYRKMEMGLVPFAFTTLGAVGNFKGTEDINSTYEYNMAMLKVSDELDASVLRVGVLDEAWQLSDEEGIKLADRMMAEIKKSRRKVFFIDTQHSTYLKGHPVSWEEFKKIQLRRIEFLTRRYSPDYYCVVIEPSTYHEYGIQDKMDMAQWVQQTQAVADLVKRIRPQTKTAIIIGPAKEDPKGMEYLRKVIDLQPLDIIGVEIYYPFQARQFEALEEVLADHPHKHGKELWLAETWNGMPFPYTEVSGKEEQDALWIKALFNYAQKNDFDGFIVWPFQYFLNYSKSWILDLNAGKKVDFSQRTRPFSVFKEIIREVK